MGAAIGPRRARGFSLLEVMVALAILAGALLAVTQLTSSALQNHARAVRLETATLLARGKLVELRETFDKDGFKDSDQEEEGTFEREGHPEVRWKVEVIRPRAELGPDQLLTLLLGGQGGGAEGFDIAALLGAKPAAGGEGASKLENVFPGAELLAGALKSQLGVVGEQMKKGLREVRLTITWQEGARTESFTVVTHVLAFARGMIQ
ncbi:MAG TPA: prepilin-type N-terminal cleavage/methylation domain-containing protein [Anaeromyxobacter sp.]|nr:prepilin-type N-terminal cleavage/methylation domain-containing protein [Anaeromyxobacter sp.]